LAVAVCADPALSRRYLQDGPIVTYHLMLAARFYGLGTCWIAGLDETPGSKKLLGIPEEHYLVTVTPLGFPAGAPRPKERKPLEQLVREID
jgi:nitroreductase